MIASTLNLTKLCEDLEAASLVLQDAHATYAGALARVSDAKKDLETTRARLIAEGVDGKNEAQREAKIRLELAAYYEQLHEAETDLVDARCSLDVARIEWDTVRYTIRAFEALRGESA